MRRLPAHALAGLALIVAAQLLLWARFEPVRLYFTPIAWSGYILLVDGLVLALGGRSQLASDRAEFIRCALLSTPIWLVFEAYNLRLENWAYVGLPDSRALRWLGYGWSFATILPAMFETSDLLLALARRPVETPRRAATEASIATPGTRVSLFTLGALCLLLPIMVPRLVAPYLFGLVWIGFIFLLDPITASVGRWSAFTEWARGERARFTSLLAGGLLCGFLWEFWNYWAQARWIYIFPIGQEWKLFEMPLPGFLGFPPFAVECFLMYEVLSGLWRGGWARPLASARS